MTYGLTAERSARRVWLSVLAAALPATAVALSPPPAAGVTGCTSAPPAFRFLRFTEDFDSLRNPACRSGPSDALKAIALDEAGVRLLTLGGDLRWQLINARHLSFGNEGGDNHNVYLQRYHVHASLLVWPELRLFAELKSNEQHGREPGPLGVDEDRLDIHQAFADFGAASSALLRVGRQELVYGSGRRIFPRNGPNVRGNFDAVRWMAPLGDWRLDAFVFRPVAVDPGSFDDNTIDGQTYAGIYATGPHAAFAPAQLDLYYLVTRREGARFQQGAGTELRHTIGSRVAGRTQAWDHDHEASLQWGRFGAGSIAAWALASETGYTWRNVARRPRASLRVSIASGDRDPADPGLQTFHPLLPRGGAVDEGFNVSAANIAHARAAVGLQLLPAVEASLALSTQWRTSRRDGVYGPGGGLIRGAGSSAARHVGDGIDFYLSWAIHRHAALDLAAGYFVSGRFVAQSGSNRNMAYLTQTLRLRF